MKLITLFIALALVGFLDQIIRCHQVWDWSQVHHEGLILLSLGIAVGMVISQIIQRRNKKRRNTIALAQLTLLVREIQDCHTDEERNKVLESWINANDLHPENVKRFESMDAVLKYFEDKE